MRIDGIFTKNTVSGTYVFLPAQTFIKFTLMAPPTVETRSTRPPEPLPVPKPKVWSVETVTEVSDAGRDVSRPGAILDGIVRYRGRTASALLLMNCDFPTKSYPELLPLEVILRVNPEEFTAPGAPGMPINMSETGRSQLSAEKPLHVNAVGQNRTTGARLRVFYEPADMQDIVDGAGKTLSVSLAGDSGPIVLATFTLPSENAPVKLVMQACLQKKQAEAEALKARLIASCLPQPSKSLNVIDVVYADTGKSVPGDRDEMSNSASWSFPAASRAKPARRKVMMCSYFEEGANSPSVLKVPIPATASTCSFVQKDDGSQSESNCYSADHTAPASTPASTRPH